MPNKNRPFESNCRISIKFQLHLLQNLIPSALDPGLKDSNFEGARTSPCTLEYALTEKLIHKSFRVI